MSKTHNHYNEVSSTQDKLINILEKDSTLNYIVSTKVQTAGKGRSENQWDHYKNNLAFSFNIKMAKTNTLTALEIGVHICDFFINDKLSLKWPNDIINSKNQKCGGILIKVIDDFAVVGVGLNYGKADCPSTSYSIEMGTITNVDLSNEEYKNISENIYDSIINSRYKDEDIIKKWNGYCCHLGKDIELIDEISHIGKFLGIGSHGEALIDLKGEQKKFFTGTLRVCY